MGETIRSVGGRVRGGLSWGLFCVLSADWWRLTPSLHPQLTPTFMRIDHSHILVYRSCSPLIVSVKGKCSHQLLRLSCDFCLSSCHHVCLREVAVGHDFWLYMHTVLLLHQQSNRTVIFIVFCSFFLVSFLFLQVCTHLHRFIWKFDILYSELIK